MKRAVFAGFLLIAGVSSLFAQTPGQPPEGYPAAGEPGIVKLISTGAEPRTALRYVVPATYKERLDTTVSSSMAMEIGGMSMPAMPMPVMTTSADLAVTDVSAAGDVTYTIAFTGLTLDASASPDVVAQLQELKDGITSIKGSATVSNRGVAKAVTLDMGKLASSQVGQMIGSLSSALKNMSTPLPEEAVGIGARWEVRNTLEVNGMKIFQRVEVEVVAIDGKTISFGTKLQQKSLPQAIVNPLLPPGADIQLLDMTGSGSGKVILRLGALVPTSEATVDSTMLMQVSASGTTQQMSVSTMGKTTIGPGK